MIHLKPEERRRLITILERMPLMGDYQSRRQILISAGLDEILPQLDLQGPPFVVVGNLVETLERYGRITFEQEALGRLINRAKELVGTDDETQTFLDHLLTQYNMMVPVKVSKKTVTWQEPSNDRDVLEKIIGENTLKSIAFLELGLRMAKAVAYVQVGNQWSGTGFMVSPSFLATCNHVIPSKDYLSDTVFRFNYQITAEETAAITKDHRAAENGLFCTNTDLDYTIVELAVEAGKEWGFVDLRNTSPAFKDMRVNIIQHPAGLPKQISLQNNFVAYADGKILQYYTSTMGGSSGSPVFNDKWQIVGLHHAGGMLLEPGSPQSYYRNEGIAIAAILKDLPEHVTRKLKGMNS